ncbi:MAG: D-alanine--D-alanine ligase [Candidatus Omnitrophica bacterium]|nr:D-alanine--D-alanine ligase [Candidatus Omnitrophota bacterium]MCK5259864.1 D-alanine--D-alanine ligase [Candidatus Omnitrophota bacterium]
MMDTSREQFGRVGVLMGGVSSEREISLKSGKAITEALLRQGCDIIALDILDGEYKKIRSVIEEAGIDAAFIALHGHLGEDGTIQSILEEMSIPYTGSGIEASRLAIDKALAQNLFKKNNINVPSYVTLSRDDQLDIDAVVRQLGGFPVVVKPACEGSSIGIHLAMTPQELRSAITCAREFGPKVLLERYIEGKELTVGILGQEALPVVEICPKRKFFDYEAKYTKGMTDYIVPAGIPEDVSRDLKRTALCAHHVLGCADFSRVDFILDRDQAHYVLEVNTIPGFTSMSLLPKAAFAQGISFDQLCFQLMELAHGKKKEIKDTTLHY